MIMMMKIQLIENKLNKYRNIMAILILIMLIVLSGVTYKFFEKQNEIIKTGGYTDGKVKCVCTQEAWDQFMINVDYDNLSIPESKSGIPGENNG